MLKYRIKEIVLLAVLYMFILIVMPLPIEGANTSDSLLYIILNYSREEIVNLGELGSAYNIVVNLRSFNWYVVLLPVITTFCGAQIINDYYIDGIYKFAITRTTRKKYAIQSIASGIISCTMINVIGVILFASVVYLFFPALSEYGLSCDENIICMVYGNSFASRIGYIITMLVNIILVSILCFEIIVALLFLIKDMFYAVSTPMVLMYLGQMIMNYHYLALNRKYGIDFSMTKLKAEIFNLPSLVRMDKDFTLIFGLNNKIYFACFIALVVIGAYIEVKLIMRKKNIE